MFVFQSGATPMKTVTILSLILFLAGCGSSPQTGGQAKKSSPKTPTASKATKPEPEAKPKPSSTVDADSFAGIPEAIRVLTEAAKSGGKKDDELMRADKWLGMQGDAAVEPLASVWNDEQADLAGRIAVGRILRRLGPAAKPALKQALGSETRLMRLNAIQSLGCVQPTDPDIIQTLLDLIDGDDERIRLEAILALANIGTEAEDMCTDKLVAILNDAEENRTLRDAAKRALKKVNPRRKFTD